MQSKAATVADYIAELPDDRRRAVQALRAAINAHLDAQYEEVMQYGMICWVVPHRVYPKGYHTDPKQALPFVALASQKNHLSLYLMGVYCGCADGPGAPETDEAKWFRQAWTATGRKLEMGKSCVRFKRVEDVPLEVVGEAVRRLPALEYIARYEAALAGAKARPRAARKAG
jgi:hypothetical protein